MNAKKNATYLISTYKKIAKQLETAFAHCHWLSQEIWESLRPRLFFIC